MSAHAKTVTLKLTRRQAKYIEWLLRRSSDMQSYYSFNMREIAGAVGRQLAKQGPFN